MYHMISIKLLSVMAAGSNILVNNSAQLIIDMFQQLHAAILLLWQTFLALLLRPGVGQPDVAWKVLPPPPPWTTAARLAQ